MTIFDFILVLTLVGFVWFGFWFGVIHMAGGLLGTLAGAWLAGHFYDILSAPLEALLETHSGWVKILAFLVVFVAVNRLVGFGFYLVDRTFKFLTIIPFLKTINRLAGAILGLAEGVLVIGLTLFLSTRLDLPVTIEDAIATSDLAQKLMNMASILMPLLPEMLRVLQPYVPGVNLPIPQ